MAGDYTRFSFKPHKDFSGVFKQQGRVDLDADFNELLEIVDRRWRSETIDIIGHCIVPNATPDAFLVIPTAIGAFEIGIGRMYVDGIQVENHGLPPLAYLADLGELNGTSATPYSNQPYLPAPLPPTLAAAPNTTDLVYIDVWQREVTALEDPSLREIALGGPDTTTRIQSAWQVRVLQDVGQHGCGDDIPEWDQLIAPSAGRLTTTAVAPPASDDPCIISPSGGYRGLENRLYRVEIHSVGPIGGGAPAKFKWSRNNATIASSVSSIPSTTEIVVQQVGRDQVLRFRIGDWMEITDDFREFQSLAGHMAQVTVIDEANRVITFNPPIPATINFDATDPLRHTRVRRWDQTLNVDANGLLDVVAGPIDIEDGIRVTFDLDPAGGSFKVGDYWVFAARTADGSVEILQDAPPRGILHHYCRLGLINWGPTIQTTTFTDCRDHWPTAECECCTVTVGDGVDSHGQFTDIQQAINALGNRGGLVCIGRGFYLVTTPLQLDDTKRNVIIRGMGPATRIVYAPPQGTATPFLNITRTEHVRLEDVFVVSLNLPALVRITASSFVRVEDCILVNLPGRADQQATVPRVIEFVENCSYCEIIHNALLAGKAVASARGQNSELIVRDNQVLSTQVGVVLLQARGVEIVHNQFRGLPSNVFPPDPALTRDTIDAFQLQVSAAFRAAPTLAAFQAAGILIYTGNRVVIAENLVTAQVAVLGFLLLNVRIERNDILSLVGAIIIFAILVKVEDNFVLGLFAGLIHAGIVADLDCTSNEWLGIHGLIWMSLAELRNSFGPVLAGALGSVGFAGTGQNTVNNIAAAGTNLTGAVEAFGMALLAKVHRNVFLTFYRGIYKTDPVISADISIVDNSFTLCSLAGIELGSSGRQSELLSTLLGPFITFRHLVQSNSFAVRGRGIVTSTRFTVIEQNSVSCPSVAVDLDGAFCTVRNNYLRGQFTRASSEDGLVILHRGASNVIVAGNQILSAPGHSILIQEDVFGLTIDDNLIQGARRIGIGTRHDAVAMRRTQISRNRVEACQGEVPAGSLQFGGAVSVGEGQDARVIDNSFRNNSPPITENAPIRWFAVYFEDVDGIEVSGNTVTDNATVQGLGGTLGAIGLQGVRGIVRVQSNVVRGNGGAALMIGEARHVVDQVQQVLVQNNHFSGGPNQTSLFVFVDRIDSLLFEGNQCIRAAAEPGFTSRVRLLALRANVCCNNIEVFGPMGMEIVGAELVVNANSARVGNLALRVVGVPVGSPGPVRVIVTSNLTTGLSASSTGVLLRVHNLPPP
jgi:hypothetical protein